MVLSPTSVSSLASWSTRNAVSARHIAAGPAARFEQRDVQGGQVTTVDDGPGRTATGDRAELQCGGDTLAGFAELVADRRAHDHTGIGDVHRRTGVLHSAGVDLDLRLGPSVAVGAAEHRQVRFQRLHIGVEQRGDTRHVDDRIEAEFCGAAQNVPRTVHVGAHHLRGLARIGGDQCRAVQDGVATLKRTHDRVAVGDVADRIVGDIDPELGDAGVQPVRIAHQKSDGMTGVGNAFAVHPPTNPVPPVTNTRMTPTS